MRVDWNCAELLGEQSLCQMIISTSGKVALAEEGGRREIVGSRDKVHEVVRMSDWMVEAAFPSADGIRLSLLACRSNPRQLDVAFEEGTLRQVALDVRSAAGQLSQRTFEDVSSVVIAGGVIGVECEGGQSGQQGGEEVDLESELSQALAAERAAREAAEQQAAASAATVTQLQSQLAAERQHASALQGIAASNLDTALANARTSRDALSQDLQDRLSQIDDAQREVDDLAAQIGETQTRIAELERRRAELAAERERLEPLEEARTLDCDQANADLEELRARFGADEETSQLMQTDEFLSGNSVRKTLSKVTKELESIERRIGLIITYRETFMGQVHQAMVNGNGMLPLSNDLERGYDGDGGEPETQDQEA